MTKLAFVHRDFEFHPHSKAMLHGPDVKAFQVAVNRVNAWRKWPLIAIDGECGRQTITAGRRAGASLGILLKAPGVSQYAQHLIRHPRLRTPQQVKRGKAWQQAHIPKLPEVQGNNVIGGGTLREKICAGAEAAWHHYMKFHDRFYSQPGFWDITHGITGEPHGARSDCSQWVTAIFHAAGAPDPNGNNYHGGFTGTLASHCKQIPIANRKPGDLILYGTPPYHHVELFVGPGTRTIGHGSPPVDPGDIFFMASPHCYRPPGID
jgi:hypothetical protein